MCADRSLSLFGALILCAVGCSDGSLEIRDRPLVASPGLADAGIAPEVDPWEIDDTVDGDGIVESQVDNTCDCTEACAVSTCVDVELGSFVGEAVYAGTLDAKRCSFQAPEVGGSCSEGGEGGELSFGFTAPSIGLYTFELEAERTFGALLYVRDGGCDGRELACAGEGHLAVAVPLREGQRVTVVADTVDARARTVDFVLHVTRSCPDRDGDGVGVCDNDCDDDEARRYPGAPEICGDAITNACESSAPPDSGCGGRGVFVSVARGRAGNPGSIAEPLPTIGAGIANARELGGSHVYVAHGDYNEHVVLPPGMSIHGSLDPDTFRAPDGPHKTEIRGDPSAGDRPALVVQGGEPSRLVTVDDIDVSYVPDTKPVVRIAGHASPWIRRMRIRRGLSLVAIAINPGGAAATGHPRIEDSEIWGGIQAFDSRVTLVDVTIKTGSGWSTPIYGVDLVRTLPGTRIESCEVMSSQSSIRILDGSATVVRTLAYARGRTPGGAIAVAGAIGEVALINNVVLTNDLTLDGTRDDRVALVIAPTVAEAGDLLVHSNYLRGGRNCGGRSAALELRGESFAAGAVMGRFRNNILDGGSCAIRRAVAADTGSLLPAIFENNGLFVDNEGVTDDRALYAVAGGAGLGSIEDVNALAGHAQNIEDRCGMSLRADGGYRIDSTAVCVDAGTAEEAPAIDYEGRARPQGPLPDIGPSEALRR